MNKRNKIEIVTDTENKEWLPGGREEDERKRWRVRDSNFQLQNE